MTATDLAPPTDDRTAQTAATDTVASALAGFTGAVEIGGVHYEVVAGSIRRNAREGQLAGIVSCTLTDGTRKHAVAVTLMVSAVGLR